MRLKNVLRLSKVLLILGLKLIVIQFLSFKSVAHSLLQHGRIDDFSATQYVLHPIETHNDRCLAKLELHGVSAELAAAVPLLSLLHLSLLLERHEQVLLVRLHHSATMHRIKGRPVLLLFFDKHLPILISIYSLALTPGVVIMTIGLETGLRQLSVTIIGNSAKSIDLVRGWSDGHVLLLNFLVRL